MLLGSSSLFFTGDLPAVVFHEVDTTIPLKVSLSSYQHNRIVVDEGYVNKLIFPERFFEVSTEEESGQVFVSSKINNLPSYPLVISVITGGGQVQDLEVVFEDKSSEVIVLKEKSEDLGNDELKDGDSSVIESIRSILASSCPKFHVKINASKKEKPVLIKGKKDLSLVKICEYKGTENIIEKFEAHNAGSKDVEILEKDLSSLGSNWVFIRDNTLKSEEKTTVLVSRRLKNER
jgi:hypothetical protein